MTRTHFTIWLIGAWLTPAVVAGLLGWQGIWGSGGALMDYLIPIPVAGGALHVPSFIVTAVIVRSYPTLPDGRAALLRALCVGIGLVGVALLINIERAYLGITTDLAMSGVPWQANPLGLFLLSDMTWAVSGMLAAPALQTSLRASTFIVALLPAMYIGQAIFGNTHLDAPFVIGHSHYEADRGDQVVWIYTRLAPGDPAFAGAALAFIANRRPEDDLNAEDVAVYFTDSLDTARGIGSAPPLATLCLYEDGTPDRWLEAQGDCFSGHLSFANRLAHLSANIPSEIPRPVASELLSQVICAGVTSVPNDPGGRAAQAFCGRGDRQPKLEALRSQYGDEQLSAWLRLLGQRLRTH